MQRGGRAAADLRVAPGRGFLLSTTVPVPRWWLLPAGERLITPHDADALHAVPWQEERESGEPTVGLWSALKVP